MKRVLLIFVAGLLFCGGVLWSHGVPPTPHNPKKIRGKDVQDTTGNLADNEILVYDAALDSLIWESQAGATGTADSIGIDTDGDGTPDSWAYSTGTRGILTLSEGANITFTLTGDTLEIAGGAGGGTADSMGIDTDGNGTVDAYLYSTVAGAFHLKKGSGITLTVDTDTVTIASTGGGGIWDSSIIKVDTLNFQIADVDTTIQILHDTTGHGSGQDSTHFQVPDGALLFHGQADDVDTTGSKITAMVDNRIDDSLANYLPLAGGTMSGDVAFGGFQITDVDLIAADSIQAHTTLADLYVIGGGTGNIEIFEAGSIRWEFENNRLTGTTGSLIITDSIIIDSDTLTLEHLPAYFVKLKVHNATGATLDQGTPVFISGATGDVPNADSARADDSLQMPAVCVLDEDIANGADGFGIFAGDFHMFNTSGPGWSVGDPLYVAPTGGLTSTQPVAPNLIQKIGEVTRVNVSQGEIYVFGAGRSNDLPHFARFDLDMNSKDIIGVDSLHTDKYADGSIDNPDLASDAVTSAKILTQTIVNDDIDTTVENFVFDDAYKVTSAEGDSILITAANINDSLANETKVDSAGDGTNVVAVHPIIWKEGTNITLTVDANGDTVTIAGPAASGTADSMGVDTDGDGTVDDYLYSTVAGAFHIKKGSNITLTVDTDTLIISGAAGAGTADSMGVDTDGDGTVDGYMYSTVAGAMHLKKGSAITLTLGGDTTAISIGTGGIGTVHIFDQTILNEDIDTTSENFVFDGAFHITSAEGDSAYVTAASISDTAAILRGEMPDSITTLNIFPRLARNYFDTTLAGDDSVIVLLADSALKVDTTGVVWNESAHTLVADSANKVDTTGVVWNEASHALVADSANKVDTAGVVWNEATHTITADSALNVQDGSIDLADLAANSVDSTKVVANSLSMPSDLAAFTEAELEGQLSDVTALFTNNVTGDVTVSGATSTIGANVIDSTNIADGDLSIDDMNWRIEYMDLSIVHGYAPADSTHLFVPIFEGFTPVLFVDSTNEASAKDTVIVSGTVPYEFAVDSIIIGYKVTGASVLIDSLVLRGPDKSTFTNNCDSTYYESGTDLTSTSFARLASDITDFTARAGDRFCVQFSNDLAADDGTVKVYYIQLAGKR